MFILAIILTAVLAPTVFLVALFLASLFTGGLVWILGPVIPAAMGIIVLVGTWRIVRDKLKEV